MRKRNSIPESWEMVPLAEIGCWSGGGTPSKARGEFWEGGTIPWVSPKDMKTGHVRDSEDHITSAAVAQSTAKLVPEGSVLLVTRSGILQHTLPVATNAVPVTINQDLKAITPADAIDPTFVRFALVRYAGEILRDCSKAGTTVSSIETRKLQHFRIPLAPAPEQSQVVRKLEELFSRLDAGNAALHRVLANLNRYRASVLKSACEGRLVPTEAELARGQGRDYEPADVLLDHILNERRARWEEQELAKLRGRGTVSKDDRWKRKYSQPDGPDTSELPNLPQGWVWASTAQLGAVTGGITQHRRRARLETQLPYLRVANVYADELRLDDVQEIGVAEADLDRALLKAGDLLIVEGNGSRDQIGRVAMWDGSIDPCLHQNHLIKVRTDPEVARFVLYWLLSPRGRAAIERVASSTSGLYTLSLSKVAVLPVPLPPLSELRRIVNELERLLALQGQAREDVRAQRRRSDRLRHSILKRAFEGRLVPQDSTDEPANVLLERIRAGGKAPRNRAVASS